MFKYKTGPQKGDKSDGYFSLSSLRSFIFYINVDYLDNLLFIFDNVSSLNTFLHHKLSWVLYFDFSYFTSSFIGRIYSKNAQTILICFLSKYSVNLLICTLFESTYISNTALESNDDILSLINQINYLGLNESNWEINRKNQWKRILPKQNKKIEMAEVYV